MRGSVFFGWNLRETVLCIWLTSLVVLKSVVRNPQEVLHIYLTDVWVANSISEKRAPIRPPTHPPCSFSLGFHLHPEPWELGPVHLIPYFLCDSTMNCIWTLIISESGFIQTLLSNNCWVFSSSDPKHWFVVAGALSLGLVLLGAWKWRVSFVGISGSWCRIYLSRLSSWPGPLGILGRYPFVFLASSTWSFRGAVLVLLFRLEWPVSGALCCLCPLQPASWFTSYPTLRVPTEEWWLGIYSVPLERWCQLVILVSQTDSIFWVALAKECSVKWEKGWGGQRMEGTGRRF